MTDVDAYVAANGVTRCPTAFVAPSTGETSQADKDELAARGDDPVGDAWRAKNKGGWSAYWEKKRSLQ